MKTEEYSYVDFEKEALDENTELIEQATNMGIDVNAIILNVYENNAEWEIEYALPKIKTWLEKLLEQKNAKPVVGVVVGFTDVKGYNMPMSMALISSDNKNKELRIGWSPSIKKLDGSGNLNLMNPAMIDGLAVEKSYDNKGEIRKDWWLVDVTNQIPLTVNELLETLNEMEVIKDPEELIKNRIGDVIVTKITITRIYNPSKRIADEQIAMPIWQRDDSKDKIPRYAPVFTLSSMTDGGVSIRCYLSAPHLQRKYVAIGQIEALCEEATRESPEPAEQALFLEGMLRNRDAIIIGRIFAIEAEPGERNNGSVSMSVYGIIMIPKEIKITPTKKQQAQQTLPEEKESIDVDKQDEIAAKQLSEDSLSPVESAVRENVIKVVHMRAQKPLNEADRKEFLKTKITMDDLVKSLKVGNVIIDGKKKTIKPEIVEAIIEDMKK